MHSLERLADTDFTAELPKEWFITGPLQAFLQGSSALPIDLGGAKVSSVAQSVPIRIVLYNYMDVASPVPTSFHLGADPRTMPVHLSMSYTQQLPMPDFRRRFYRRRDPNSGGFPNIPNNLPRLPNSVPPQLETPFKDPWSPVSLIPLRAASPGSNGTVTPTGTSPTPVAETQVLPKGTVILTQFDIRSLFDISRPGYYRFSMGDATPGSTNYLTYDFSVSD